MNKEEIEIIQKEIDNKYLETQGYGRNLFVCKIVELERYIETLQSQLDIANKKLDKIKEFVNKSIRHEYRNGRNNEFYLELNENKLKQLQSIIGGE